MQTHITPGAGRRLEGLGNQKQLLYLLPRKAGCTESSPALPLAPAQLQPESTASQLVDGISPLHRAKWVSWLCMPPFQSLSFCL